MNDERGRGGGQDSLLKRCVVLRVWRVPWLGKRARLDGKRETMVWRGTTIEEIFISRSCALLDSAERCIKHRYTD